MDATEVDLSGSDLDNVSSVDRPLGSGLQFHTQFSPGERNDKFSQNGKFGQNVKLGQMVKCI